MCRGHEEWCIVQKDGTQQASTHRHLDFESAADKGWVTTSTTKKKICFISRDLSAPANIGMRGVQELFLHIKYL